MTQFNAPGYDVERPTGRCAFCGRELAVGESYIAALVELDEAERRAAAVGKAGSPAAALGLRRLDVSMEAWQSGQRPERLFGHWKATVQEPNRKKRMFVDDEVLLGLLRRLGEASEPQRVAFRFVLTLILMRRKMLRYDGTVQRGEQQWWQVVPKLDASKGPLGKWNDAEPIEVLDPHLDQSAVLQVTEQLGQILEAEL